MALGALYIKNPKKSRGALEPPRDYVAPLLKHACRQSKVPKFGVPDPSEAKARGFGDRKCFRWCSDRFLRLASYMERDAKWTGNGALEEDERRKSN